MIPGIIALALALASAVVPASPRLAADPVTRTIEQRPPARPLAEARRVDAGRLAPADLDRLASESRERWSGSGHGPMLARILPERLQPSELPQPESRGARLTGLYCVQCHHLPDPAMHDAKDWPRAVERMVPRMEGRGNLGPLMSDLMRGPGAALRPLAAPTPREAREIVAYLQQNAQRGLDANARPAIADALDEGAGRAFRLACSQCHALPDPVRHTAHEWPEVVRRMQHNMQWMNRVVAADAETREPRLAIGEIVEFLQRHARR